MKGIHSILLLALVAVLVPAPAPAAPPPPVAEAKIPSDNEMAQIREEIEILRGKKFVHDVPARTISEKELRDLIDREVAKEYPGRKLAEFQELMVWLDLLPPGTDLKAACANLMVDQVAGLYDSDTKEMRIPTSQAPARKPAAKPPEKKLRQKLERFSGLDSSIVFLHEYVHALEDQYWPLDDPEERDTDKQGSSDRGDAHSFLVEGTATRLMVEAFPMEIERAQPGAYIAAWKLIHSGLGEMVLDFAFKQIWKSDQIEVAGVPETLARAEVVPYSFGYSFCRRMLRDWGLDGLDYIYEHRPVSTEQVMHPEKCWEWRDFPVQVGLPETLPGDWKRLAQDTFGEAGMAVLFGCHFKSPDRGLRVAAQWDGDRAALYTDPDGHRLLVWASAWDSPFAAERFARACLEERTRAQGRGSSAEGRGNPMRPPLDTRHSALDPRPSPEFEPRSAGPGTAAAWARPDGHAGIIRRSGKRVILIETDNPQALQTVSALAGAVTFTEPPKDAARAAANPALLRFNPLLSRRIDGDYAVTRSLWGLLWRHDHNSVGAADRLLLGTVGKWRRTASLNKWSLGWGLAARHESEARRGVASTTLLPWGVLGSQFSALVPQTPANTVSISRATLLWGLAASRTSDKNGKRTMCFLPGGLLFRSTTAPHKAALHVLGTGVSRTGPSTRVRLLGIPLWTSRGR